MKGRKASEETRIKMREAKKGKIPKNLYLLNANKFGENNPNWKGGITTEKYRVRRNKDFRFWREAVFSRDNYICQKCKIRGGKIHPHHIFNFATYLDLRFAIDNGITLCQICHKKFHKKYGYRNNTREQLEEWMKIDKKF